MAQTTVRTVPAGYITMDITAGKGTARTITVLSLPLQDTATAAGQVVGRITGVTANTISNSAAGWTAGGLSVTATPYQIRITSGTALGRTFLLSTGTPNTATTVTLDPADAGLTNLTALGIVIGASGDTYELIPADTLSSIFGTPATTGILGSTTSTTADYVQLFVVGTWKRYYFNTTSNDWRLVGLETASNNLPIRADSSVMFSRLPATALQLLLLGRVPSTNRKALIANSGTTFLADGWPLDATLSTSGIQTTPGWVASASSSTADVVQLMTNGAWGQYYHNGTNWLEIGLNKISDTLPLPAASGVIVLKKGAVTGNSVLTQTIPYNLSL